eukprot:scaffold30431_cov63-Phaeocystis_antarctica.AAC.3
MRFSQGLWFVTRCSSRFIGICWGYVCPWLPPGSGRQAGRTRGPRIATTEKRRCAVGAEKMEIAKMRAPAAGAPAERDDGTV